MVKYTKKSVQKGSGLRSIKSRIKRLFKRKEKAPINPREAESIARRKADSIARREVASVMMNKTEKKSVVLDKIFSRLCKKKAQLYLKDQEKEGSGILYKGCNYIYPQLFNQLNQHKEEKHQDNQIKLLQIQNKIRKENEALTDIKCDKYKHNTFTGEDLNNLLTILNPFIEEKIKLINSQSINGKNDTVTKNEYDNVKNIITRLDYIIGKILKNEDETLKKNIEQYSLVKAQFESLYINTTSTKAN